MNHQNPLFSSFSIGCNQCVTAPSTCYTRKTSHLIDKQVGEFSGDPMLTYNIYTAAAFCKKMVFFREKSCMFLVCPSA
jgi:hypothetical protein